MRDAEPFSLGFEAAFDIAAPRDEVQFGDQAFLDFEELFGEDGGRATILKAAEHGRALEPELRQQCEEATSCRTTATLRAFPAWRCALANVSSPLSGKIVEALTEDFVKDVDDNIRWRSFSAAFEVKHHHVRVVLHSMKDGPDVSEIARFYEGCGHAHRAFFTVRSNLWARLWVYPEHVLWDVQGRSPSCLSINRGDKVTVTRRGERFRDSPFDEWSWCYSCADVRIEGWIPTLSHTLFIATAPGKEQPGISEVDEGDLLIAKGQRGDFYYGWRYRPGRASLERSAWFSKAENVFQPVHHSKLAALLPRVILEQLLPCGIV